MRKNITMNFGGRRAAVAAFFLFALVGALSLAASSPSAASLAAPQASPDEPRVIRVVAADIARLPSGKSYVVDMTKTGVTYDLDGTERAIDWTRVVVRDSDGEKRADVLVRERFPKRDPGAPAPKRLLIGATDGLKKSLKLGAAPSDPTEYICDDEICWCWGGKDCNSMLSANICSRGGVGFCVADGGDVSCTCSKT